MLEFNASTVAFVVMTLFILGGALGVVTTRNLIHATLYLILSLFGVAGYFVLLSAPFLVLSCCQLRSWRRFRCWCTSARLPF